MKYLIKTNLKGECMIKQKVNVKISVIITIHNAEKYLKECLDSVCNQTFSDIEILCIDGGSTDSSPSILKEYAKKDIRIHIINDSNTSYGHKINVGIEQARGKYISVLESDDMYEPFMLEKLYEVAEKYQVDFVNADYRNFFDLNGIRVHYITKMYLDSEYNKVIYNQKCLDKMGIIPRFWTGLFRKDFLDRENIRMNESPGASFQDMSFRFLTSALAETSYHLDLPLYLYRNDNPDSSMNDSKKTVIIADEHDFLQNELKKRNITNKYVLHNAYQWKYLDFFGNMTRLKGEYRQELFDRYQKELLKDCEQLKQFKDISYCNRLKIMLNEEPEVVLEEIEKVTQIIQRRNTQLVQLFYKVPNEEIVVFGCGALGKSVLEYMECVREQVKCLTDNSEELWNTYYNGYEIVSPIEAVRKYPRALFVIANKKYVEEIKMQLLDLGITEMAIFS